MRWMAGATYLRDEFNKAWHGMWSESQKSRRKKGLKKCVSQDDKKIACRAQQKDEEAKVSVELF